MVVLVIITVLALIGAGFSLRMNADLAGVGARSDQQQAYYAADTGLRRTMLLLRTQRGEVDAWFNNDKVFRRIKVWSPGEIGGSESLADQEKLEGIPAWRFSVISYEVQGDETRIRYGITDEASKLNLLTASRGQLLALFEQIEMEDVHPQALADALVDWRDSDDRLVSIEGAESSYYITKNPPYRARNKPMETVEELLMVKGFFGWLMYGEDANRNGYLDEVEDDGTEGAFPPDDGDGILDRGLLPYVTVYSWDFNTGLDNKQRINLNDKSKFTEGGSGDAGGSAATQPAGLPDYVVEEVRPEIIDFIAEAQQRGYTFRSVGELVGLEVYENGESNYDEVWDEYVKARRRADRAGLGKSKDEEEEESDTEGEAGRPPEDGNNGVPDGGLNGGPDAGPDMDEGEDEGEDESGVDGRDRGEDRRSGRDRDRDGDGPRDARDGDEEDGEDSRGEDRGPGRDRGGRGSDRDRDGEREEFGGQVRQREVQVALRSLGEEAAA